MSTNVYMIANSLVLTNTKTFLDEKYKTVALYGASTVEGVKEIYTDINSMALKAIVYIDSNYSKEELETTFDIIKDILNYIDKNIKVFFIGSAERGNIAKSRIADVTCQYMETNKKYTTRLLEEGVLYPLLKDVKLDTKAATSVLQEIKQDEKITYGSVDLNQLEVLTVGNTKSLDTDNRHISLMQSIEKMIALNNKPETKITNKIINSIMAGDIDNVATIKASIDNETEKTDLSKEINIALSTIQNDIDSINALLKADPNNKDLQTQMIKLEQYHKNISLNKSMYQYTTYVKVVKETTATITKSYTDKVKMVNDTADKYTKSINKIKEGIENETLSDANKAKIRKKIDMLKNYKIELENSLNSYISNIDLVYNGMQTSYVESMKDIRKLIAGAKQDLEKLPSAQSDVNNSTLSGIANNKIHAIEQLSSNGKQLLNLREDTNNTIKTLLAHTDNINKGLRKINVVLELIVAEQDKYISYIETQSKRGAMQGIETVSNDKYLDKVITTIGVNGVGKTGVTLGTAYAMYLNNKKKVAVLDLSYDNPQAQYYVENESFKEDIQDVLFKDKDYIESLFNSVQFKVIKMDYLESLDEQNILTLESLKENIKGLIENLTSVCDHLFIIMPQNMKEIKFILDYTTRLILVTDLDMSHYRGTSRLVDDINMYLENNKNPLNRTPLDIKYFVVNKCSQSVNLSAIKLKCNIKDNEYSIKQFKQLDKITLSKNEGYLKIKDSKAILNDINWLGSDMYE